MMKHFRNDAVIFGCKPWLDFHNVVALFQLNSQEWSNGSLTLIPLDVKYTLTVYKDVRFTLRGKRSNNKTIRSQIAMPG